MDPCAGGQQRVSRDELEQQVSSSPCRCYSLLLLLLFVILGGSLGRLSTVNPAFPFGVRGVCGVSYACVVCALV